MDEFDKIAKSVRSHLDLDGRGFIDTTSLLDGAKAAGLIKDYRGVKDLALPEDGARWIAEESTIVVRESVQLGAWEEEPRARFTIAHELAHAILRHPTRNRRASGALQHGRSIKQHEDDADALAVAILAPMHLVLALNPESAKEIASEFGITPWHAEQRFIHMQKLPEYAEQRRALVLARAELFDSGDYSAAMTQMARNAAGWNS